MMIGMKPHQLRIWPYGMVESRLYLQLQSLVTITSHLQQQYRQLQCLSSVGLLSETLWQQGVLGDERHIVS